MTSVLTTILMSVPSLLVELAALVLALARWSRHPTVSMLVVVSSGVHLFTRLAFAVVPMVMTRVGGASEMSLVYGAIGLVGTLGQVMLVAAVFTGRQTGTEAPSVRW